ncbi:BTB/POZ domain-containing protein [Tanacetum coccineum]
MQQSDTKSLRFFWFDRFDKGVSRFCSDEYDESNTDSPEERVLGWANSRLVMHSLSGVILNSKYRFGTSSTSSNSISIGQATQRQSIITRLHSNIMVSLIVFGRNMLRGPWKDETSPVLTLHVDDNNVNREAIAIALAYLYGNHPKLDDNNAFCVLDAASFLDLQVFSTWMAFEGNTRDLCSSGEETDKTTALHQVS